MKISEFRPKPDDIKGWEGFIIMKLYKNSKGRPDDSGCLSKYSMEEIQRYAHLWNLIECERESARIPENFDLKNVFFQMAKNEEEWINNSFLESQKRAAEENNQVELKRIIKQREHLEERKMPRGPNAVYASFGNCLLKFIRKFDRLPISRAEFENYMREQKAHVMRTDFNEAFQFFEVNDLLEKSVTGPRKIS